MRFQRCATVLTLVPALLVACIVHASPSTSNELRSPAAVAEPSLERFTFDVSKRDGHAHHNSHADPLLVLNETEITLYHAPTPPSYYTIDWEGDGSEIRYPGLMITHSLFMGLAFFVALPIGIALRSVKHACHGIVVVSFYILCFLGCTTSALYRKLTPNMYEGSVHGKQGYLIMLLAITLSLIDVLSFFRRVIAFFRSGEKFTLKTFWRTVVLGRGGDGAGISAEYAGLIAEEPEEFEESKIDLAAPSGPADLDQSRDLNDHGDTAQWANNVHHHRHQRQFSQSAVSDGTLFAPHSPKSEEILHGIDVRRGLTPRATFARRVGKGTFAVLERLLVFAGLAQLITGVVIYTGGCRENYQNGCLAHLIKGAIFWCYGLVSFARFLGTFAELGWAWNRAPSGDTYSAEFVESAVIFFYGATNMWMERFGANPGDPFTTKQIQHIGIAVMFCFAGLLGMGIESRKIRNWLASSTFAVIGAPNIAQEAIAEPASYSASFNPFPALVIGVTGAAMAAHTQTYLFQVQIHALWGNLLVAFSVLRSLTYFFLWLGPPRSILPSRPPTEALGSFFLACGGLVFMLSTEEVTIAAMRRGRDDVMMFMNVAVAVTCLGCCWALFVVAFKGWLKSRTNPVLTYRSSA